MDHPSGPAAGVRFPVIRSTESWQMKIDLDRLTEPELMELHHKIVERLKFLESMRTHADMMEFTIGEKVSFSPPGRGEVMGILVTMPLS
jgi:hypothetical protein